LHYKAYQSAHPAAVPQSGAVFLRKNSFDYKKN
jgi:hypothetical protein